MRKKSLFNSFCGISVMCLMMSCSFDTSKTITTPIFEENIVDEELFKLSELFNSFRLVKLETNDSCLLGGRRGCKVKKFNSSFYIQSQDAIFHFDNEGKYVKRLDKKGNGPEDYTSIFDFDVVCHDGQDELWISAPGVIRIYDAETFKFKRNIIGPRFIHQLKVINDTTILAVTPEDTIFKILRNDGTIRKSFMKKNMSVSVYKLQQFFTYDERIVYQLGDTQAGVVYDINRDSLHFQEIIRAEDDMLTLEICNDYYERYGYELQDQKMSEDFVGLITVRAFDKNVLFVKSYPDGTKELLAKVGGKDLSMIYAGDGMKVQNDLFDSTNLLFLATMTACESDDSFLFSIPVSMLKIEGIEEDDNFWLLEANC